MNIAYVNNQVRLGGAETVVEQLRRGMERFGHRATWHVAEGKEYPPEVLPLYPRLLSRLSHTRWHNLVERWFPREVWTDRAFRRLAEGPADVVHVHNFHGRYATIDALAHLAQHKPLVWTFHAFWGITGGCDHPGACDRYLAACGQCPRLGQWPLGLEDHTAAELAAKEKLLGRLPLHVVAPSAYLARKVYQSRVGRDWHIHHIPNGVDPSRFDPARKNDRALRQRLGLEADGLVILVVNRDFKDANKGFAVVEGALRRVTSELRPEQRVQLLLVGRESEWAARQLPATLAPVARGYISRPELLAECYEAADLFLFASMGENFPCVILEAMAAGCCVVATPTGGVVEQIDHGASGLLAEGLTAQSLSVPLQVALANPQLRRDCAALARHRAQMEFSEERMVSRHVKLYEAIGHAQRRSRTVDFAASSGGGDPPALAEAV